MAQTITITPPVTGNSFSQYTASYEGVIARFIAQTDVLSKNLVYLVGDFTTKYAIPTLKVQNVFQAHSDTPSISQGNIAYEDKILDISNSKVDVFMQFNPNSFSGYWKQFTNPGQDFNYKTLPAQSQSQILSALLNQVAGGVDEALLVGSTSLTGASYTQMRKSFNGVFTKAIADSNLYKVTGTTTLNQTNIISEMERALRQARQNSNNIKRASYDPDFKFILSYNTWELYSNALRALTYKSISPTESNASLFHGIPVVASAYAPDNRILGIIAVNSPKSNIWAGTSTIGDLNDVIIDRLYAFSNLYFAKMTMAFDTCIPKPEEAFLY